VDAVASLGCIVEGGGLDIGIVGVEGATVFVD